MYCGCFGALDGLSGVRVIMGIRDSLGAMDSNPDLKVHIIRLWG